MAVRLPRCYQRRRYEDEGRATGVHRERHHPGVLGLLRLRARGAGAGRWGVTTVLLIVGIVVLALVLFIGWSIIALAGEIDQEREDRFGERRS